MAEVLRQAAGHCPDPETIAAYLDGRLSARERAHVTEHLSLCEDCYAVFAESARLHVATEPARVRGAQGSRVLMTVPRLAWSSAGAALATAACVWLLVGSGRVMWSQRPGRELQALVAAVGTARTIEPRLVGGFAHGPLLEAVRGRATADVVSPDVRIAAARLEKAANARPTAQNLRALGAAHLIMGQFDTAIDALQSAARQAPTDATVLSDLSAAYLVRAKNEGAPEDYARAASQADKATKANAVLPEALFNRALAFEALSLRREARESWEQYLRLDGRSAWADEARRHVQTLSPQSDLQGSGPATVAAAADICSEPDRIAQVVKRSPPRSHEFFDDDLLPRWADAYLAGDRGQASRWFECARSMGTAFASAGDLMAHDTVEAIDSASRSSEAHTTMTELARAHVAFRAARQLYEQNRFKDAESQFLRVIASLQAVGSDDWVTAAFYAQSSIYYQQRLREVVTSLPALIDFATMRQYVSAAGRLHSLKGVLEVNQSALAASLEDYYAALANYEQVGDLESAAAAHNQIAENLQALGEPRDSWNHHGQALSLLPIVTSPLVRHQILWFAIQRCLHDGMPDVALHFENAFLENASNWANGNAIGATTSGYLQRSLVLSELGDFESARRDLDEARRRVADVRDPALAERWRTEILATAGELSQHDSRADAIGALTPAIEGLQKSGSLLRLSHLYLLRGRAHLARHDVSEAASDFDRGIAAFEYQHNGISQERFRISHFDEAWELFTDMVRLQLVEKKRADVALAYVERARARTLLEAVTRTTKVSPTLNLSDVQRRLPADAAILSFVTLSDTLVTWVLTRQSVDVLWQPLDLHRLEATVDSLLASLRNQDGGTQIAQLSSLYDMLIEPTARARQGRGSLIVIPDGPLHRVPFAALVDRHTGRYLIEEGSVSIAPSISLLMDSSSRVNDSVRSTGPRVLIVGNPAINRRIYPGLPNLDGAEAEAMDVAGQHPGADLLIKQHATKAEFLRLLRQAELVHFAGHAVANAEYPWLSRLLFAPEAEPGSDTLFAHELAGEHLNDLQLVVLAACGTGKGAGVRGEGVLSLARPFIAAGTRTVIASLWDVSDRDTQALFRAFYKGLQSGAVPAVALRDAQVAALHGQDPQGRSPTNWAAFTPITRSLMSVTTS